MLAIPQKRFEKADVSYLSPEEVGALLAAPDAGRWEGRRDRALMTLAAQTGLRLSELIGLNCGDVELGASPRVRCMGKGRKQRLVPLTAQTVAVLRVSLRERGGCLEDPLFPTRTGRRLTDDAIERRLAIHAAVASRHCSSLAKKNITPHVLRHTNAMALLDVGVDVAVIALWLGHADIRSTPGLPPRGSRNQRKGPGPHNSGLFQAWALQGTGQSAGLPGKPVIIPT